MWPLIFSAIWLFVSFQLAVIVGFIYLHITVISLFYVSEKQKDKLIEIVEYLSSKDGLIDSQSMVDPSTIETADDAINAILSLKKPK
jgi:hypothetical protein